MEIFQKYKRFPVQAKASLWYTVCNFAQKGISFVVVPLYIRLLTTAQYGEWTTFQSWRDLILIFATLNLFAGVYTKAIVDIDKDRDRYTSSMQGLGTVAVLCMFCIYLLFKNQIENRIHLSTQYMLLLFVYYLVYPSFCFWTARQRVEYKYQIMVVVTIITSLLIPLVSIALLWLTSLKAEALIVGYLTVYCVVGAYFYIRHFIRGRSFFNREYWIYALKFNIPLIPHYLSLTVLAIADRIMIRELCGESEAGIYGFAYQIASAITVLSSAINGSRVPWTYEKLRMKDYISIRSISTSLVVLIGAITFFASLLAPEVIGIIGTKAYTEASAVIPVVLLGVFYTFVYDLYATIEFYFGATKFVMFASTVGAVLNVILNYFFIPIVGYIAAAYTTLICYCIFMIMHSLFAEKVMSAHNVTDEIYDNKSIRYCVLVVSGACLGSIVLSRNGIVRIFIAISICLIAFVKKDKIIYMITNIRGKS